MADKSLSRSEAENILTEAGKMNEGRWVTHSMNAAKVCERLASNLKLDKDKAYVYGLLHDIGRREGVTGVRHIIDGYNYMKSIGYEDVGRYCLTHSYMIKNIYNILGKMDMTDEETNFVKNYLANVEYTLYDKIVQISDHMALHNGITLIERRIMDIHLRYGISDKSPENWKTIYKIQKEIEEVLGHSIYELFSEVKEDISKNMVKDIFVF